MNLYCRQTLGVRDRGYQSAEKRGMKSQNQEERARAQRNVAEVSITRCHITPRRHYRARGWNAVSLGVINNDDGRPTTTQRETQS